MAPSTTSSLLHLLQLCMLLVAALCAGHEKEMNIHSLDANRNIQNSQQKTSGQFFRNTVTFHSDSTHQRGSATEQSPDVRHRPPAPAPPPHFASLMCKAECPTCPACPPAGDCPSSCPDCPEFPDSWECPDPWDCPDVDCPEPEDPEPCPEPEPSVNCSCHDCPPTSYECPDVECPEYPTFPNITECPEPDPYPECPDCDVCPSPCKTCPDCNCTKQIPPGYEYFEGLGYYRLHNVPLTWYEAKATCEREGAHLAIFNSQEEANVLVTLVNRQPYMSVVIHLGFFDLYEFRSFVTIFGQRLEETGYGFWGVGQPDNDVERCGSCFLNGALNDVACDNPMAFLCELPI